MQTSLLNFTSNLGPRFDTSYLVFNIQEVAECNIFLKYFFLLGKNLLSICEIEVIKKLLKILLKKCQQKFEQFDPLYFIIYQKKY